MAHKSTSRPTSRVRHGGDFWLNRATRDAVDNRDETPLSEAHKRHEPLRLSVRRPTSLIATLNFGPTYSVPLPVRDLSPTDAFVEMPTSELESGTSVEFVLHFLREGELQELRLPAQVVRADAEGVALQFGSYDDDAYTTLVKLLYTA
jgi:hypothetical protein